MLLPQSKVEIMKFSQTLIASGILAAFLAPGLAASQTTSKVTPTEQSANWRAANDAVGRFLRGHVDIVRAEQRGARSAPSQAPKAAGELISLADAKSLALSMRSDLFAKGTESAAERNALALEVAQLMMDVEIAWVNAVGRAQLVRKQADATEAADIAHELAQRMGKIGNWPNDRVISIGLQAAAEKVKLLRAQQLAQDAENTLRGLLLLESIALPDTLPAIRGLGARQDLTKDASTLALEHLERMPNYASLQKDLRAREALVGEKTLGDWKAFAQSRAAQVVDGSASTVLAIDRSKLAWNHDIEKVILDRKALEDLRVRTRVMAATAQNNVKARHAEVMLLANQIVPLALQSQEEAVYRYNGMFISTWTLLESVQEKAAAEMALIDSQMRYWEAEFALKAFLAGAPYRSPSAAAEIGAGSKASGKGH
jgi:outer membrane protein, multidrug efflux system